MSKRTAARKERRRLEEMAHVERALAISCPKCGASAGVWCMALWEGPGSSAGADMHARRWAATERGVA